MLDQARTELSTLRDLLRFAVSRFNEAKLFFGHGTDNAWDEAAYLLLHSLHLPLDRLEPFLDAKLTSDERADLLHLIDRRVKRTAAGRLPDQRGLAGRVRFYVDERVIVPRSFIAELLREQLAPWIDDPDAWLTYSTCAPARLPGDPSPRTPFPAASIDAVDLSPDALAVAAAQRRDYDLAARIRLVEGNLFAGSEPALRPDHRQSALRQCRIDGEPARRVSTRTRTGTGQRRRWARPDACHPRRSAQHLRPNGLLVVEIGHNREALEAAFPDALHLARHQRRRSVCLPAAPRRAAVSREKPDSTARRHEPPAPAAVLAFSLLAGCQDSATAGGAAGRQPGPRLRQQHHLRHRRRAGRGLPEPSWPRSAAGRSITPASPATPRPRPATGSRPSATTRPAALVIVELGGNDFLRRRPEAAVKEDLRAIVAPSGSPAPGRAGRRAEALAARRGNRQAARSTIYAELASEEKLPLVAGVLAAILSDPELKADPIHPNADGYRKLAVEGILPSNCKPTGLLKKP
jgi:ribosomal protein L3 glutamine methyltransferase